MFLASTIQLLRIKFSFFLMPVFWFALSQVDSINTINAIAIFLILHLLVYPASNGYNSYMDRDTSSIGGVKNPMQPTKELFYVTIVMDFVAIVLSLIISNYVGICVIGFIAASRAYSYRGIRLKKYPIIGFLVTSFFQGAVVFFLVYQGSNTPKTLSVPYLPAIASSLLIGSFYPLTQIYQHKEDKQDNVTTLSILLGYNGTFIFTAIVYFFAMNTMLYYFLNNLALQSFIIIAACNLPVLAYFFWWMVQVRKDETSANFKNTMRMNVLGSVCSNIAFITALIVKKF